MIATGVLVVCAALVGYFFGSANTTACRQRATFAEAELARAQEEVHRLTLALAERREPESATGFDDHLGGVAR